MELGDVLGLAEALGIGAFASNLGAVDGNAAGLSRFV